MTRMRLPFTTLLITVALANFATLVVTYLLSVPVWWAVPIYLGWRRGRLAAGETHPLARPRHKDRPTCVALAVLTLVLLTIPRLGLRDGVDTGQYGGLHRR